MADKLYKGATIQSSSNGYGRSYLGNLSNVSAASFSYYLAYTFYSISCFLGHTTFEVVLSIPTEAIQNGLQIVVLMLLMAKFAMQRSSLRGWITAVALVAVGFVTWRASGEGWLFWLVLFVVCSESISIRVLASITLCIASLMTLLTMSCSALGIIENRVFVRNGVTRQAMGFTHPNSFGYYLLLIDVAFSTLRFGKNPLPDMVLIALTLVLNLSVADSRSSALLLCLQVVLLAVFYFTKSKGMRRAFSVVLLAVVFAIISLSFYFMVAYNPANPLHLMLNRLFSTRFSLAHGYYLMQPLTLFGSDFSGFTPIYWENGRPYSFVVDNAYCHLILRYGLVPTAIFLVGLVGLLVKLVARREWNSLFFGLVLMSIYGIGENLGIRVECNFFLVAMGTELLFGRNGLLHHGGSPISISTLSSASQFGRTR